MCFSETPEADALPGPTRLSGRTSAKIVAEARRARVIADKLAQQALDASRAELEASRPKCPNVTEGAPTFVTFTKYQAGREYAYAAVGWRTGRSIRWAVTGATTERYNWRGLLAFIGEANWSTIRVVTDQEYLLESGDEPPVAEEMGSYGRVLSTRTVNNKTKETQ